MRLVFQSEQVSRVVFIEQRTVLISNDRADAVATLSVSRSVKLLTFSLRLTCRVLENCYSAGVVIVSDINIDLSRVLEVSVAEQETSLRVALSLSRIDDREFFRVNDLEITFAEARTLNAEVESVVINEGS